MRRVVILLSLAAGAGFGGAVGQAVSVEAEDAIENLVDDDPDAATEEEMAAGHLLLHPVRLNSGSPDRLAEVPGLSRLLAERIVRYRRLNGPFERLEDLLRIQGIGSAELEQLRPYVYVNGSSAHTGRLSLDVRVHRRVEAAAGYRGADSARAYAGGPLRFFSRLEIRASERLSLTVCGDKDPGERFLWGPGRRSYGYDFVSGHIRLEALGPLEAAVLGDFDLRFGLGLQLWTGGRFSGLLADPGIAVSRTGTGLSGRRTASETGLLRGAVARIRLGRRTRATAFASRTPVDARLDSADAGAEWKHLAITSLPGAGLHRTESERRARSAALRTLHGAAVEWLSGSVNAGLLLSVLNFDHPLAGDVRLYRHLQQPRLGWPTWSAWASCLVGATSLTAEVARDADGSPAALVGASLAPQDRTRLVFYRRYVPAGYSAGLGAAPTRRQGAPSNETGWLGALDWSPFPETRASIALDRYRFPGPRFDGQLPAVGRSVRATMTGSPAGALRVEFRAESRTEETEVHRTDSMGRSVRGIGRSQRRSFRAHVRGRPARSLDLGFRWTTVVASPEGDVRERGWLLQHEARWNVSRRLRLEGRIAFFQTDGFDSRIGAAEIDLLGAPLRFSLQGRGERGMLLLDLSARRDMTLRIKGSVLRRYDVNELGSGYDKIGGARLREIRAQILFRPGQRPRA